MFRQDFRSAERFYNNWRPHFVSQPEGSELTASGSSPQPKHLRRVFGCHCCFVVGGQNRAAQIVQAEHEEVLHCT